MNIKTASVSYLESLRTDAALKELQERAAQGLKRARNALNRLADRGTNPYKKTEPIYKHVTVIETPHATHKTVDFDCPICVAEWKKEGQRLHDTGEYN